MLTSMFVKDYRPGWRIAMCGLVLLFIIFPAVMGGPHHGEMAAPAPATATESVPATAGIEDSCPPIDLCALATVEQALPRLPVPPLPLFALVTLILAMRWQPRAPAPQRDWWLPPDRRRAFLQIFLI